MIKVILCDDEPWILVVIKDILKNLAPDITIVGEANSSIEVLQLCEYLTPDILITDINIPGINGLDLIEHAKKICPNLKTIIISGYDKFEYAQRAISLGVVGFLLKPVEEKELYNLVKKSMFDIQYEIQRQQNSLKVNSQLFENLSFVRSNLIHNIIFLKDYEINSSDYDNCQWRFSQYTVAICISLAPNHYNSGTITESSLSPMECFQEYIAINSQFFNQFIINDLGDKHTFILLINQNNQSKEIIQHFYNWLKKNFSNSNMLITCGVSNITFLEDSKENFKKMLLESFSAVHIGFYDDENTLHYTDGTIFDFIDKTITFPSPDEFYFALINTNLDKINQLITHLRSTLTLEQNKCNPNSLKLQLWSFILSVTCKFPTNDSINQLLYTKQALFMSCSNINHLFSLTASIFFDITAKLNTISNHVDVIAYIHDYLKRNYQTDISLDSTAELVGLHPTYLSKLFKQKSNITFVNYLTNIRMERAKSLLASTDFKIAEIGEMVGFNDSKYFSRIFKKTYDMSPKDYRDLYFPKME